MICRPTPNVQVGGRGFGRDTGSERATTAARCSGTSQYQVAYIMVPYGTSQVSFARKLCGCGFKVSEICQPLMRFLPEFRSIDANDVNHFAVYADSTAIDNVDFRLCDLIR